MCGNAIVAAIRTGVRQETSMVEWSAFVAVAMRWKAWHTIERVKRA
jgi:hypothetical protein